MRLPDFNELDADSRSALVYGQPYETADGSTVVTVATVRSNEQAVRAKPVGVFVIRGGKASWKPAASRVALMGELIGLVGATLATLAMVRRPPWPDLSRPK
jgi:hypothetical protein